MGRATKVLENATLGIDIGSTSSRLVLQRASGDEVVVECDHYGDFSRYDPGDFPTSCYPFDDGDGDAYIGSDVDPNRIATSLKPIFLLLSPIAPEDLMPLIREYPDAEHLWARMDGNEARHRRFRRNLKKAVLSFFDVLKKKTVATCKSRSLRITSVGVSVPAQWPAVVEDYIADILLQRFFLGVVHVKEVCRGDIFFHSETQALAHYLLRHHGSKLMGPTSKEEAFLVADFGGQNLNISTYQAQTGPRGETVFFEMNESVGVVGGSERQNHLIGEHCEKDLRSRGVSPKISPEEKQHFINEFRSLKKRFNASHDIEGAAELLQLSYGNLRVSLTPEIIRRAYDEAMGGAFRALSDALRPWSHLGGDTPLQVIVAGGTARSKAVQEDVTAMCDRLDLDPPEFAEWFGSAGRYRSLKVATGAAYATTNVLTVERFFARGAAVGIQVRERGEAEWFNTAPILFYMKHENERQFDTKEGDELKLICDPFVRKPKKRDSIEYRRSYDMHTVGTFKEGKVKIRASFQPAHNDADDPKLSFSIAWRPEKGGAGQDGGWFTGGVTLPLWFDRSSSCVLPMLQGIVDDLPRQALVGRDTTPSDTESTTGICLPHQEAPYANMGPDPMELDFSDTINDDPSGGLDGAGQVRIKSQSPEFPSMYLGTRFEPDPAFIPAANGNTPGTQTDPIVID